MSVLSGSWLYDILLLFILLASFIIYKWKKRMNYFVGKGIPFRPPRPFFEENNWFYKEIFFQDNFQQLYDEFKGHKYVGYFNLYTPSLFLRDPDLIMRILTKDFASFNDHGLSADPDGFYLDDNMFFQSGPKWKALRRKLSPTFTSGKLKMMTPLINDCIENLGEYLRKHLETGVELRDTFAKLTLDIIGSVAFGVDSHCLKEGQSEFKDIVSRVYSFDFIKHLRILIKFTENKTLSRITLSKDEKDIASFFRGILTQAFDHRTKTGTKRNDFVDLLLQLKEQGTIETDAADADEIESETVGAESIENVKLEITDEILTAQSFLFYIAGHETTATTMTFLTYLLAKYPETQKKAREEVRLQKSKFNGINHASAKSMEYLNACILETLRLYPPVIALPRRCTKTYRMDDGFVVEKGTNAIIPIMSIQRDPNYFPDPDSFIPERFLRGDSILPGTFLPFGGGPRICAGMRFALLEMALAMASLIDNFEILPNPKTQEPIEISSFYILIKNVKGGLWVNLKKIQ